MGKRDRPDVAEPHEADNAEVARKRPKQGSSKVNGGLKGYKEHKLVKEMSVEEVQRLREDQSEFSMNYLSLDEVR